MYNSLSSKKFFSKPETNPASRSHSSLSTISLKTVMSAKPQKQQHAIDASQDYLFLQNSKSSLESHILKLFNTMKKLKNTSKTLKLKESELTSLQNNLIRSNENLLDNKVKLDKAKKVLNSLLDQISAKSEQKLFESFQDVTNYLVKIKRKRKNFVNEETFVYVETSKAPCVKNVKVKSPYVSSVLSSPKQRRKLLCLKSGPRIESGRYDSSPQEQKLNQLYLRVKNLLEFQNPINF